MIYSSLNDVIPRDDFLVYLINPLNAGTDFKRQNLTSIDSDSDVSSRFQHWKNLKINNGYKHNVHDIVMHSNISEVLIFLNFAKRTNSRI